MNKLLFILVLNLSLLLSPPPRAGTTDPNGRYISLNRHAGFFLNPDTYGFIFPAIHPKLLFADHALRQNRPFFILAGSVIGYSITFLTWPVHYQLQNFYGKFYRGIYLEEDVLKIGNFYLGFILLNILILWIALFLFEKIFYIIVKRPETARISMYLLMVFIAANPITKAFFWTVHQQMFAFLTPLLCFYILLRCRDSKSGSFREFCKFFILSGLLLLVYGNFLMLLPALLFCFVTGVKQLGLKIRSTEAVYKCLLLVFLFFLPTFCWILLLKMNGVNYYNFEIEYYHQVVWIGQALKHSFRTFSQQLFSNSLEYLQTMREILYLMAGTVIVFIAGNEKPPFKSDIFYRWLLVCLSFLIFYWLLGFYAERLTNTLIPVIICFWVIALSQKIGTKKIVFILSSLAATWYFYVLMSYGPFY
jgi:hypothetical protein